MGWKKTKMGGETSSKQVNGEDERWQEGCFLWVTEAAVEHMAVRTEWGKEFSSRQTVLLGCLDGFSGRKELWDD